MTLEQKINIVCSYKGISQAALARLINMTPSNFNQKIKRSTFSEDELAKIERARTSEVPRYYAGLEYMHSLNPNRK